MSEEKATLSSKGSSLLNSRNCQEESFHIYCVDTYTGAHSCTLTGYITRTDCKLCNKSNWKIHYETAISKCDDEFSRATLHYTQFCHFKHALSDKQMFSTYIYLLKTRNIQRKVRRRYILKLIGYWKGYLK